MLASNSLFTRRSAQGFFSASTRRQAKLAAHIILIFLAALSLHHKAQASFAIGDRVSVAQGPLNVRATASTSGTLLGTQPTGAFGTVIGGPTSNSCYTWWNINYDTGVDGWSVESSPCALVSSPAITVSISPTSATVLSGATKQFAATVTGTTNTAVTWSATLGTISTAGLFTAPTVTATTTVTVKAVSQVDTTKSASATVTVTAKPADTTPPYTPTGLTATAVSSSQINLAWTASTDNVGVVGYKIFRGSTQIATMAGTFYQNTGLSPSTTYTYTVSAYDAAGNNSAQSASVSATTLAGTTATTGIWTSAAEVASLPMSGTAWNNLKSAADTPCGTANMADQQSSADNCTFAEALVFARTGIESYRTSARANIAAAVGTEVGGRQLAWGRNLVSYVLAADLIHLPTYDPTFDQNTFRPWINKVVFTEPDSSGGTMVQCNETKPQNWGVECGASRAATDIYTGNTTDLARVAKVFRGYLGDTSSWNGYDWSTTNANGGLTFVPAGQPEVPVNFQGGTVSGHNVDGALIAEMSRCGSFSWPPCYTNYTWTGAAGMIVEADILYRAGYDVYNWSNKAILRAYTYLDYLNTTFPTAGWWTEGTTGPNNWQPWIVNKRYGTNFIHQSPTNLGWSMSWTDWTHQ